MPRTNLETLQETMRWLMVDTPEGHAKVEALLAPDFELIEPDGLPYGGVYRGAAGWWRFLKVITTTWLDFDPHPGPIMSDEAGENFAFTVEVTGRSARTGKPFATSLCEHWHVRDGRVRRIKPHYFDTKLLSDIDRPEAAAR